ncbi:MAG TPA: hypothetical protein VMZ03_08800 [Chitinophagaceae bacterium]|nr:hypothetical protein [Chitinophagaceae bacterium]
MRRIRSVFHLIFFVASALSLSSCKKDGSGTAGAYDLNYGDSVLYLRPSSGDYIVYPATQRAGEYSAFPEGIEINDKTGAINLTKSETGLRYRITHTAPDGTVTTTKVVLSGITFPDRFYHLSQNDTIAFPVYNANSSSPLPITGSIFDDGGGANSSGCEVKTTNGQINLAQTVRNGLFGATPVNDDRKDIEIVYRLNDGSNKTVNKLKVRLYYYTSMATVAPDLLQTLADRQNGGVFLRGEAILQTEQAAKPRPPCVIIIAN